MSPSNSTAPGRLYVVGAGGFGREVAWLASEVWGEEVELRFVVDRPEYLTEAMNGIEVELLSNLTPDSGSSYVIAVGDPRSRIMLEARMRNAGFRAQILVHPGTRMSNRVQVGEGVIIAAGNVLTTEIRLGNHVHVNLACTIGHDVTIGAFSTLSPGVHVSGNVKIGAGAFIGTGANIINGSSGRPLLIGDGAVVAAGACVTKDVAAGVLVAGVPAQWKRDLSDLWPE